MDNSSLNTIFHTKWQFCSLKMSVYFSKLSRKQNFDEMNVTTLEKKVPSIIRKNKSFLRVLIKVFASWRWLMKNVKREEKALRFPKNKRTTTKPSMRLVLITPYPKHKNILRKSGYTFLWSHYIIIEWFMQWNHGRLWDLTVLWRTENIGKLLRSNSAKFDLENCIISFSTYLNVER